MTLTRKQRWVLASVSLCLSACYHPSLPEQSGAANDGSVAGRSSGQGADAGASLADAGQDVEVMLAQHERCERAFPKQTPPLPDVARNQQGELRYNDWYYWACEPLDGDVSPTCSVGGASCERGESCLHVLAASEGLCMPEQTDRYPYVVATFQDGACVSMLAAPEKSYLCCSHASNLDCRLWPLLDTDARSRAGELCVEHSDCEPGLVCTAYLTGELPGVARCTCPEADPELSQPQSCAHSI